MSDHRIAWALHNYELEQTIIRLRNSRNRLLERELKNLLDHMDLWCQIRELQEENSNLKTRNRELSDIIAAP